MDPFTEKELIDNLKLISASLIGIKAELADLNIAVRELNFAEDDEESDHDLIDKDEDSKEGGFIVSEKDIEEISEADDEEESEETEDKNSNEGELI